MRSFVVGGKRLLKPSTTRVRGWLLTLAALTLETLVVLPLLHAVLALLLWECIVLMRA